MTYSSWPLAPDIADMVHAFREAGQPSFDTYSCHLEARQIYSANCQAAALAPLPSSQIENKHLFILGKKIPIRHYKPSRKATVQTTTVFLHGGGWVIGDLDSHDNLCRYFCEQSGSDVIAIDYGLAPEHGFDEILNQCLQAVTYIIDNYSLFDVNPERVVLMGDSAGGYLANYVAHYFCAGNRSLLAQILLYPVVSLQPTFPSYTEFETGFMLSAKTMHWFLSHCQLDKLVNPIATYDLTALPYSSAEGAVFIATVGYDPLRDEGISLVHHLVQRGAVVEYIHLPRHVHGIFTLLGKVPSARKVIDKAATFLLNLD